MEPNYGGITVTTTTDKLTTKTVEKARAGKHFDGAGLYLDVKPSGSRYWRVKYRFAGKEKLLALGVFPDVGLKEARQRRDAARALLRDGIDPSAERKAVRRAAEAIAENNFEAVSAEWLAKQKSNMAIATFNKTKWMLDDLLVPWLGKRPIGDIDALEVLAVVQRVEARGAHETAHRVKQLAGRVFRYACATGRATRDPTAVLKGALTAAKPEERAAITEPAKVGELLRAIDGYAGGLVTRCALQLAPLVFVRPGELRTAEWAEIDLDAAEWNIPAEKMKMRRDHLVPLSQQAIATLREIEPLTGRGRYVFPGERSRQRPMSENTLNAALRRLGFDKDTMTAHGFRATARTILDEHLGFRPDYIEHQLAHTVKDPNGRAYNRTAFLAERRSMMQSWSDFLDALRTGANVVPIRKGKVG